MNPRPSAKRRGAARRGCFTKTFAGDSSNGKTPPHVEAIEASRRNISWYRAGPHRRPGHRRSGGALHHPRAVAVRLEGRAARGQQREPAAAVRPEPRAAGQDARPAGDAAGRAARAAEHGARSGREPEPAAAAARAADRRGPVVEQQRQRLAERVEQRRGQRRGRRAEARRARPAAREEAADGRERQLGAARREQQRAGERRRDAAESGAGAEGRVVGDDDRREADVGRRREHRLLPAGGRVQDRGGRRAAARAPGLPGLRIEGLQARRERRHLLPRADRAVLEIRGHELRASAAVRCGSRHRRDPLYEAVSCAVIRLRYHATD
ncbi:putative cell division ftsn transmembrane protein [Burkholderia mallei]|nr:putative cell division ftsn transmembrane protein [Burkholderia mallei]KOS96939.1 putative cell division ftsn transmembrane protein [Burkholderia mallei]KOT06744.1 putative cell division ftsn transmembrane protein [Burkholderia mallei]KOT16343.1 putative cell division ftsn transmembrane protein [Burkholderia mallei]